MQFKVSAYAAAGTCVVSCGTKDNSWSGLRDEGSLISFPASKCKAIVWVSGPEFIVGSMSTLISVSWNLRLQKIIGSHKCEICFSVTHSAALKAFFPSSSQCLSLVLKIVKVATWISGLNKQQQKINYCVRDISRTVTERNWSTFWERALVTYSPNMRWHDRYLSPACAELGLRCG